MVQQHQRRGNRVHQRSDESPFTEHQQLSRCHQSVLRHAHRIETAARVGCESLRQFYRQNPIEKHSWPRLDGAVVNKSKVGYRTWVVLKFLRKKFFFPVHFAAFFIATMEKNTHDEVHIHTAHLRAPREGRKSAVLFFNGTFTPIHKG